MTSRLSHIRLSKPLRAGADEPGAAAAVVISIAGGANGGMPMARCDTCGNDYDKTFQIYIEGQTYTFDSFECAIHKLAPHCSHCDCRIIGHGVEARGRIFCCAHCADHEGAPELRDRA
jgi:hypothetical protein